MGYPRPQITCGHGADRVCSFRAESPLSTIGASSACGLYSSAHGDGVLVTMQSTYRMTAAQRSDEPACLLRSLGFSPLPLLKCCKSRKC